MLRILQVIHSMNLGGAENFIMNIYRCVDKNSVQFDFLVNEPGKFDEEIKSMGGKIWAIPYVTTVGPLHYRRQLRKFFKEHTYVLIHSHLDKVSGIVVECAKKEGVKVCITHSHSTDTTGNCFVKMLKNYYWLKINRYADVKMACSKRAAVWLYGTKEQAEVIENGIDVTKFMFDLNIRSEIRKQYLFDDNSVVVGHVGRYSKVKNHEFLVEIFEEFHKSHGNSYLILCGDGDRKEYIREMILKRGLGHSVVFVDANKDVYRIYNAMDVFVFPSLYEGMSLCMIEAQTNGLPIVASDTIDTKVDITKSISFLGLNESVAVWRKEIEKVLVKQREPQRAISVKEAGYDVQEIAKKLINKYMESLHCKVADR